MKQGLFSFIIVDNINSNAQDVSAYWYAAKGAGYEVYICETELKDTKVKGVKLRERSNHFRHARRKIFTDEVNKTLMSLQKSGRIRRVNSPS